MTIVHIIILVLFFAAYFYFRLPKDNAIRVWIDKHPVGIGNGFLIFWVLFFMGRSPRLALFFGLPMLIIGGLLYYGNRKRKAENLKEYPQGDRDPNDLGDPREAKEPKDS